MLFLGSRLSSRSSASPSWAVRKRPTQASAAVVAPVLAATDVTAVVDAAASWLVCVAAVALAPAAAVARPSAVVAVDCSHVCVAAVAVAPRPAAVVLVVVVMMVAQTVAKFRRLPMRLPALSVPRWFSVRSASVVKRNGSGEPRIALLKFGSPSVLAQEDRISAQGGDPIFLFAPAETSLWLG